MRTLSQLLDDASGRITTIIIFHRHDDPEPIIHNLQNLRDVKALHRVLVTLVEEHYCHALSNEVEVLIQDEEGHTASYDIRLAVNGH